MKHGSALGQLASPDWLLAGFEEQRELFQFAQVSRSTYHDSPFLDHRVKPMPEHVTTASGTEVDFILDRLALRPAAYIFHTAFCASTLLSLCLDHPSRTLILREPMVLTNLGKLQRGASIPGGLKLDRLKRRVFGLMNRGYEEETVVIKPSNFANSLVSDLLKTGPGEGAGRRCLLLGSSLHNLLISILKKEAEARELMPVFLPALLSDSDYLQRIDLPAVDTLDLLQQSVVFWHCQRHFFQCIRSSNGAECILPISMESFFLRPLETLVAVNEFLRLGLTYDSLVNTVQAGAFRHHSKSGLDYSPEQQRLEAKAIMHHRGGEIRKALEWAEPLLRQIPIESLSRDEETLT